MSSDDDKQAYNTVDKQAISSNGEKQAYELVVAIDQEMITYLQSYSGEPRRGSVLMADEAKRRQSVAQMTENTTGE